VHVRSRDNRRRGLARPRRTGRARAPPALLARARARGRGGAPLLPAAGVAGTGGGGAEEAEAERAAGSGGGARRPVGRGQPESVGVRGSGTRRPASPGVGRLRCGRTGAPRTGGGDLEAAARSRRPRPRA
jgi:hypothetical protein